MKIVLLGYMGSGKSSVGEVLAERLVVGFIDLDDYITQEEHMSISEIFKNKGEIYFRRIETKYLDELLNLDQNFVLSVGGGTPCYANNIEIINQKSTSFYLNATLDSLYNRLKRQRKSRPLIANIKLENLKEFLAKHLFERRPFYAKAAVVIQTDNKTVSEVVSEIRKKLL